jgi:hypothetical protein
MDFASTMDGFQEALLMCRPRDVFKFASRYFKDDKSGNPEEAHAVQMLPFLALDDKHFKSVACTIYCQNIGADSSVCLSSQVVLDIVERMDLRSLGLNISSVDEVSHLVLDLVYPTRGKRETQRFYLN